MQLVDEQRAPEGTGLGQVDDEYALGPAQLRVVAGRLLKLVDARVRDAGHHVKGRIPQRERHGQEQDRDVGLSSLPGQDQVRQGQEDRKR